MRGNGSGVTSQSVNSVEHAVHHRLDRGEHVLLLDERHLEVELVELAGAAVGARVLVAKAGRDLEVAVEARHHEQLLVLLRRLRQRVELAGMQARGHQEVARALGRARGQDRRLELDEALRLHAPADARDHPASAAGCSACIDLAAQVEEAVAQPRLLGIVALGVDLERQRLGRRLRATRASATSSTSPVASFGLTVSALRATTRPVTVSTLSSRAPSASREERMLGLEHDLGDAVVVAQVDEQQLAVVALAVHPARQPARSARRRPARSSPQLWVR